MTARGGYVLIKVAGFWNFGWNVPISEFNLWSFPLRDFNVDEFIMCPVTGIDEKVTEYKNINMALKKNKKLIPVYIDEKAEVWLEDFEHPENVLYILGRPSYSPYIVAKAKGEVISVKIRTKQDKGLLWSHQAITIVLYDRMLKENGDNSNR